MIPSVIRDGKKGVDIIIKIGLKITNWDEFEEKCSQAKENDMPILDENGYFNKEIFGDFSFCVETFIL